MVFSELVSLSRSAVFMMDNEILTFECPKHNGRGRECTICFPPIKRADCEIIADAQVQYVRPVGYWRNNQFPLDGGYYQAGTHGYGGGDLS